MSASPPLVASGASPVGHVAPEATTIGYRADIDGLRAIAVAAVVLFHAGVPGVPGGFVGVDIFFVISGYLIGGQIFNEARAGEFSFLQFYSRRVRRILPALFALLASFVLIGLLVLTPLELRELGKEAIPAIFGLSNFLFYTSGDYFAPSAENSPLLMTWSLGVEEQFYLLFPFVLLVFARRRDPPFRVLVGLSLLSFVASLFLMGANAKAAFYLLPTRAWELGVGAALAVAGRRLVVLEPPRMQLALSCAGLALLALGLVAYTPAIVFPGYFALLPVLGTALLLASRSSVLNQRVLSVRPLTFVGKISYSWYLWHWPVFYLYRILGGEPGIGSVLLVGVSLGLAVLSWRFVEQPFRKRVLSAPVVLVRYAATAFALTVPCAILYLSNGWSGRLSTGVRMISRSVEQARSEPCLAPYGASALQAPDACLPPKGKKSLVMLGDSHSSSLSPAMRAIVEASGAGFGEMTKSSCGAFHGFAPRAADRPGHWAECIAYQTAAFDYIERHPEITTVVLTGYWGSTVSLVSRDGKDVDIGAAVDSTITDLERLGRRVVLIGDVPTFRFDPYARVVGDMIPARRFLRGLIGGSREAHERASGDALIPDPVWASLSKAASTHDGVQLINPHDALCSEDGCRYRDGHALFYSDFQHLTAEGARAALEQVKASDLFQ